MIVESELADVLDANDHFFDPGDRRDADGDPESGDGRRRWPPAAPGGRYAPAPARFSQAWSSRFMRIRSSNEETSRSST